MTADEVIKQVMTPTYESIRVQHMGWSFGPPTLERRSTMGIFQYHLTVPFTCVCGQREFFQQVNQDLRGFEWLNVPQWLYRRGSFSRDHLAQDGFTEAQILEIERKGEEFDRIVFDNCLLTAMRGRGLSKNYDANRLYELMVMRDRYAG